MKLNVLYTINRDFINPLLVSIISLLKNSLVTKVNLHIITSDFRDEDYLKIEKVLFDYNVNIEYYPLEDYHIEYYGIPDFKGTQIANARLFFQEILAKKLKSIDNLLYLDSDTIVVGELGDLDKYDGVVGAVKDQINYNYIRQLNLEKYYNSGVLYINIKKWLEEGCQDKLVNILERNEFEMIYPDQDLLNLALNELITEMPQEYNMGPVSYLYKRGSLGEKAYFNDKVRQVSINDIYSAKTNPRILHSYGFANIKPWNENSVNPYTEEFLKYICSFCEDFKLEEVMGIKRFLRNNKNLIRLAFIIKTYFSGTSVVKKYLKR